MTLITRCSLRLREVINLIFISLNREGAWRKCFSGKEACCKCIRRVWIYKRGYHNLYIEEEQATQWPKEKVQKDKQRVPFFPSETHELYSYSLLQKKCLPKDGPLVVQREPHTYLILRNLISTKYLSMLLRCFDCILEMFWYCGIVLSLIWNTFVTAR